MNNEIERKAENIASYLTESEYVRCISHNDADGLASAGILAESLRRLGTPFHTTIIGRLSSDTIEKINEEEKTKVIFFDMGSGQKELIKEINSPVAIVDHHPPNHKYQETENHLNPHHFGINGTFEACASTLSYLVCKKLDVMNKDLGSVALAGAVGDMQHLPMSGLNLEILNEMRSNDIIEIRKGIRFLDNLEDSISESTDPFLSNISGDLKKTRKVLEKLDIDGEKSFWELDQEDQRKLSSFIVLKLLKQGAEVNRIKSTIGDIYKVNGKEYNFVSELTSLLDSCGKQDKYGIALSLIFDYKEKYKEAREIKNKQKNKLLEELKGSINNIKETKNLYYVETTSREVKGTIAGILVDYLFTNKPILAYNKKEDVSISARGNKSLINNGLNLSEVMSKSAKKVGGNGGGHNIASGASIPKEGLSDFLEKANELIGNQI